MKRQNILSKLHNAIGGPTGWVIIAFSLGLIALGIFLIITSAGAAAPGPLAVMAHFIALVPKSAELALGILSLVVGVLTPIAIFTVKAVRNKSVKIQTEKKKIMIQEKTLDDISDRLRLNLERTIREEHKSGTLDAPRGVVHSAEIYAPAAVRVESTDEAYFPRSRL